MIIKFQDGTCTSIPLHVHPHDTIAEVKSMILHELRQNISSNLRSKGLTPTINATAPNEIDTYLHYPSYDLCPEHGGTYPLCLLKDHLKISDYNVQHGDTLNVVPIIL